VSNSFDPRQNVLGGLAYLRFLLAYYRGDVALALAAYNAGEKAVDRYRGIPPFAETRGYVQKVLELYGNLRHPFDARHAPSPSIVVSPTRAN
jgi:soluble lytic murein transglycosylase-like protein